MQKNVLKGYGYGCLSSISYGLIPLFALPMLNQGLRSDNVLFYRYLIAVVGLGILLKLRGESFRVEKKDIAMLAAMGVLFAFSSLALFESYNYLSAGIASTILFLYPVFVTVIMALFFHEKVSIFTIFALILAFWGIVLLYKTDSGETLDMYGVVLVFVSSLTYAVYIVGVNKSRIKEMDGLKLTFYALLAGSLFFFCKALLGGGLQLIDAPKLWLDVTLLALLPTLVSCVALVSSVHYIGSTPAAILGALEPVTAVCITVLVFGDPFTTRIASGIVLIVVAVSLIVAGCRLSKALHNVVNRLNPVHIHRKR